MKRSIFIILLIFNVIAASYGLSMKKVLIPEGIVGSAYFPLFIGESWVWSLSGEREGTEIWYIGATYILNDENLGLKNCVAYEVSVTGSNKKWYAIEHEGYISRYEKSGEGYTLTRLLPVIPASGDSWSGNGTVKKVVSLDQSLLRVESSDRDYSIFKRGVGLFEFLSSGVRYRLREYVSFNKVKTLIPLLDDSPVIDFSQNNKRELVVRIDEDIEDSAVEQQVQQVEVAEAVELKSLSARYNYVQVGAFSLKANALKYIGSIKARGYKGILYRDSDNRYKVLLENGDKEGDKFLLAVRKELNNSAFMKQRRTEF